MMTSVYYVTCELFESKLHLEMVEQFTVLSIKLKSMVCLRVLLYQMLVPFSLNVVALLFVLLFL